LKILEAHLFFINSCSFNNINATLFGCFEAQRKSNPTTAPCYLLKMPIDRRYAYKYGVVAKIRKNKRPLDKFLIICLLTTLTGYLSMSGAYIYLQQVTVF